jgi:Lsr2
VDLDASQLTAGSYAASAGVLEQSTRAPGMPQVPLAARAVHQYGRKAGRARRRRPPARPASARDRSSQIRAWVKDHDIAVNDCGRIPAGMAEQTHLRLRQLIDAATSVKGGRYVPTADLIARRTDLIADVGVGASIPILASSPNCRAMY